MHNSVIEKKQQLVMEKEAAVVFCRVLYVLGCPFCLQTKRRIAMNTDPCTQLVWCTWLSSQISPTRDDILLHFS